MIPTVSVVVPCFNYGRFLRECVASIQRQSFENWECIIVDDGSVDDTPKICVQLRSADARVNYVRQQNSGLSAARNTGIGQARGAFIQFLDADDLLQFDKLRTQLSFFASNTHVDIAVGPAAYFEHGVATRLRFLNLARAARSTLSCLVDSNIWPVNAALIKRKVFETTGLFDETLRAHEDWDLWLRCALHGHSFGFVCGDNDAALVREHGISMSRGRELMLRTAITVRERIQDRLPSELQQWNAHYVAEQKWRLGLELLRKRRAREGWQLYWSGIREAKSKFSALVRLPTAIPGVANAFHALRRLRV